MTVARTLLCVGLSLGALILGGCSTSVPTATPSAESTVKAYFAAVNTHRWSQAMELLSSSQKRSFVTTPDSDRNNTLAVSNIKVKVFPAPFERKAYPGFTSIEQALVTFDANYKKVYGASDGPQTRFVYVGERDPSGPWRILGIGTGP
jgi:Domain of unknown function (DUF4829)